MHLYLSEKKQGLISGAKYVYVYVCMYVSVCEMLGLGSSFPGHLPSVTLVRNQGMMKMLANLLRQSIFAHYLCLLFSLGNKQPLLIHINLYSSQIFSCPLTVLARVEMRENCAKIQFLGIS